MILKNRLLHERLAAIVSTLRHGEMIYIADAGSGTTPQSLVPLSDKVEIIDLAVSTNVPTVEQVMNVLWEVGDFEGAFVTENMKTANPEAYAKVKNLTGEDNLHELRYLPEFYDLRDRVKAFIQTGDYGVHSNIIIIAGYPSPVIPVEWMVNPNWLDDIRKKQSEES